MQLLLVLSCVAVLLLLWFPAEAEGSSDCADRCGRCAEYAKKGYCKKGSRYYNYVATLCKRTCGLCGGGDTEGEEGSGGGDTEGEEGSGEGQGGVQEEGQGGGEAKVDAAACLKAHNDKRALHEGTPALQWDDDLARQAKKWADYLLGIDKMKHSTNEQRRNQGENLYWSKSFSVATCADAVQAWYDEIADYPFGRPPQSIKGGKGGRAIGHFTQVVWKNSRRIGVALASKRNEKGMMSTYIVARYSPPGNYWGQFAEQVGNLKRLMVELGDSSF